MLFYWFISILSADAESETSLKRLSVRKLLTFVYLWFLNFPYLSLQSIQSKYLTSVADDP